MIRVVLLDLDNTLLENDMQRFLPPYFAALGRRMANLVAPDELVRMLLASTQVMMNNQDPTVTNQQAFEADFFPSLGHPESEVRPIIHAFYEEDFPALKKYTRPKPRARLLAKTILDRGYDVVIATNPIFPRRAIEHRLEWAGLLDLPFSLVTTYENSHFCKPNPCYYQEILDKLGCPAGDAIMVGDDFWNDIQPAMQAGLYTYWIAGASQDSPAPSPHLRGNLTDCLAWMQSGSLSQW